MTLGSQFQEVWLANFPDSLPVNFLVREKYAEVHFRFYTLPGAKRYPDSEADSQEVLKRHNRVLSDLFSPNEEFFLLRTRFKSDVISPVFPGGELLQTINDPELFEGIAELFVSKKNWMPSVADLELRRVSRDEEDNLLFVGIRNVSVYAPYDGGADVFVPDTKKRLALRNKYSSWMD